MFSERSTYPSVKMVSYGDGEFTHITSILDARLSVNRDDPRIDEVFGNEPRSLKYGIVVQI
jgi:hypothetical protein